MIIPTKLKFGDEIRVISPAFSLGVIAAEQREAAIKRFSDLGLKLSFSKHSEEVDDFASSSVESRVEDIHDAFADTNVKAVITTLGGFNSNQLLKYLDYDLIAKNPKILCGYSDITALGTAIYSKTGLVTYSGPHFSTFAMKYGFDYTLEYFQKCLVDSAPYDVSPSPVWSDDAWYLDQENRTFHENEGYLVLNEGEASGTIIGGNLCTLNLLQGTEFMPSLKNAILFLEDDPESKARNFDRDLQSLLHQPGFEEVKAIVIGRFQRASEVSQKDLATIIHTKKELAHIPVIAEANFGHTSPLFTFPIGGTATIQAVHGSVRLTIEKH